MKIIKKIIIVSSLLFSPIFANNYVIGTGGQSGTYYPLGGALAKIWSDNIDNFDMKVEVTSASVENTIKVTKGDQLVGLAMGDTVQRAINGEKPFPKSMDVNVLFALYPNLVQLVVQSDSDIKSIQDLKGKRVSLGAAGSGTRVGSTAILKALGIDIKSIKTQSLNYSATTNALANGQIDAGFIIGSLGIGAITELALTNDIRIISFSDAEITKINKELPAYNKFEAKSDIYKGVGEFTVPAVWNVIIVNKNLDEELAYKMTKIAYEHIGDIQKTVSVTKFTTPENATKLANAPLHPGSIKYLKEAGILK